MRRLLVLLLLLSPVPGQGRECPPCPPGAPRPCDTGDTHTRSPLSPQPVPEELCPPCAPPCTLSAAAPLPDGTPSGPGDPRATLPVPGDPRATPAVPGDPRATPTLPGDPPAPPPGATIPLYCALLAAVVVGLVAYVAFKCWDTCRKKRQLDKARDAAESGMSPEGEKLRGDSGVFLDTPGPQEPPQHAPPEGPALLQVCPRREELERLLEPGGPGGSGGSDPAGTPGDVTSAV